MNLRSSGLGYDTTAQLMTVHIHQTTDCDWARYVHTYSIL